MLSPESYLFFRSAASLSRSAPVTRVPFFRVSATSTSRSDVVTAALSPAMISHSRRFGYPLAQKRSVEVVLQVTRAPPDRQTRHSRCLPPHRAAKSLFPARAPRPPPRRGSPVRSP